MKFFSLSFLYFLFLFKYEQRSGRQRNTMAIRKYKFRCYFKQAPPSLSTIFGSKLPHFVHTRKKKKERKKKRDKTLHLTVYVSSATHYPPLIRDTQTPSLLFFFTRSLLFRDIGLTLAPSKPEAEDPPRHPGATPVIRSSIVHPSLFSS